MSSSFKSFPVTFFYHYSHLICKLQERRTKNYTKQYSGYYVIQVDIGGHPPIPLGPPPLSLSVFQFRHNLLFLAVFWVLNFRSRFEALNDIFWENGEQHGFMDQSCSFKICSPRVDLSNEVWNASNGDRMLKLCPWEVETPIYPNGAHSFGTSSLCLWLFIYSIAFLHKSRSLGTRI